MSRQDSGRLQRELQDEMTDEIHKMVGVLKDNTLELHRILTKDNQVSEPVYVCMLLMCMTVLVRKACGAN